MTAPEQIPQTGFIDGHTIRLVSTAYIDQPALAPLADDPAELSVLEEIETLTSARSGHSGILPSGVDPAELLTSAHGYGWTWINAAWCYTREQGNRFNGPERGAWYAAHGSDADLTAQAEVAWHLSRELQYTGILSNITAYRELVAGFVTSFHDLRRFAGEDFLASDPDTAYPAGQLLASSVRHSGGNGLLYPSARRMRGQCLVAFRPHLVQNLRQGRTWVFEWRDSLEPEIFQQH